MCCYLEWHPDAIHIQSWYNSASYVVAFQEIFLFSPIKHNNIISIMYITTATCFGPFFRSSSGNTLHKAQVLIPYKYVLQQFISESRSPTYYQKLYLLSLLFYFLPFKRLSLIVTTFKVKNIVTVNLRARQQCFLYTYLCFMLCFA
jgi:hypothetical protein